MTAPGENSTKIPSWEAQFEDIRQMVDRLAEQNEALKKKLANSEHLLELTRRELELALMKIEELLQEADERAEVMEARDG